MDHFLFERLSLRLSHTSLFAAPPSYTTWRGHTHTPFAAARVYEAWEAACAFDYGGGGRPYLTQTLLSLRTFFDLSKGWREEEGGGGVEGCVRAFPAVHMLAYLMQTCLALLHLVYELQWEERVKKDPDLQKVILSLSSIDHFHFQYISYDLPHTHTH